MRLVTLAAAATALALGAQGTGAEEGAVTIGTGGETGVYYVVGQSICRLVNSGQAEHDLKCRAPATDGSIANIRGIMAGELDMGVVQSDIQHDAGAGAGAFAGERFEKERAVFSIHSEPFTVVARADSGIAAFGDLKGKRVNVGDPGSGQRATMEVVLKALGWTMGDFGAVSELEPAAQAEALEENEVDAIVYMVGHPNGSIHEATVAETARLVPVAGPEIDRLVADHPYYAAAAIRGGLYAGNPDDVRTFGVKATLVASADTPDEVVYTVVKAVFEKFDRFKGLHPAFARLSEEEMISEGLSAPLHPGAEKYYKERGWM